MDRFIRTVVGLVVVVLVAAACGDDDGGGQSAVDASEATGDGVSTGDDGSTGDSGSTDGPVSSPACGSEASVPAGETQTVSITVDGQERSYLLYVPPGLTGDEPAPLVLIHHGFSGTARGQVRSSGFDDTADQHGVVVAYPDAGDMSWNLSDDTDTDFIAAVIDDVGAGVCVDLSRTYAVGFSQGGGMSGLLSCVVPDRVAAVGMVASWAPPGFGPICPEAGPTPVMFVVGTNDTVAPPDEGLSCVDQPGCPPYPLGPVAEDAAAWAATNGCELEPTETTPAPDVVRSEYSCPPDAELVVYLHGGEHVWPRALFDTNDALWAFLASHST